MHNTLKNTKNGETAMAEDLLVQMLLDVAGAAVTDDRDIKLARAAARWAEQVAGWRPHLHNSFAFQRHGLGFWVLGDRTEQILEIRVRLADDLPYRTHARHRIAHLGHGLDVLAGEDLIPARFCTLGRRALEDHAEVLDRAAIQLATGANGPVMMDWACGLAEAAASARRYAGAQLAVTS